jgi:endonuclease YncB( thermonuclease family)
MKHLLFFLVVAPTILKADYLNGPCKVVKITDSDTVHVLDQSKTKHKIRLGVIDASESMQAFGQKAKQKLLKLIAGKNIKVEYSKHDRYG